MHRGLGLAAACLFAAFALAVVQSDHEVERLVQALDVDPGEIVADVGAGDGRFSFAFARIVGERGLVYATEVDPDDLESIRDRARSEAVSNLTVVEGTQQRTGLPEACCDAILLRRVYHHFQHPGAMRESLRRALRDDGLLLVVDFDTRGGHGIDRSRIVSEMELAGFTLVEEMNWEGRDYALLFRETAVPD